jgi:hypothetical protein
MWRRRWRKQSTRRCKCHNTFQMSSCEQKSPSYAIFWLLDIADASTGGQAGGVQGSDPACAGDQAGAVYKRRTRVFV